MTKSTIPQFEFLKNKYSRLHDAIIDRARFRKLDGYSERHHIIPRSLGGCDDSSNLVDLTYREHFLIHWLLTRMTEGAAKRKMLMALYRMSHWGRGLKKKEIIAGWQYAVGRRAVRDSKLGSKKPGVHSEEFKSELRKRMMGNARSKGIKHSPESIASRKKQVWTEERRAALILRNKTIVAAKLKGRSCPEVVESNKRRTGETRSQETCDKISAGMMGNQNRRTKNGFYERRSQAGRRSTQERSCRNGQK